MNWINTITETIQEIEDNLDEKSFESFGFLERRALRAAFIKCGMMRYPKEIIGDPNGERCSCRITCEICGHDFGNHPMDYRVIGYDHLPFLHVLCNGRRVKL